MLLFKIDIEVLLQLNDDFSCVLTVSYTLSLLP